MRFSILMILFLPAFLGAQSLRLERLRELRFGTILPGNLGTHLRLYPDDSTEGYQSSGLHPASSGVLLLTGPPGLDFTLQVGPDPAPLGGPSHGHLRASEFTWDQEGLRGRLDATGRARIRVGASLTWEQGLRSGRFLHPGVLILVRGASQETITCHLPLRVDVRVPLEMAAREAMDFGDMLVDPAGGSVVLSPEGIRACSGGVRTLSGGSGSAVFTVSGEAGCRAVLLLPQQALLQGPGGTLAMDTFSTDRPSPLTLNGQPEAVRVGATLQIPSASKPGVYQGTFTVTLVYE